MQKNKSSRVGAVSQTIFEQIPNTHKQMKLNLLPRWSNNTNDTNKHRTNYPKCAQLSDLGIHVGAICMALSSGSASFSRPDRFWLPLGHPGSDLVDFWKIRVANLPHNSKIPGQQMAATTPSTQNQARVQANTAYQSNIYIYIYIYMVGLPQIRRPCRVSGTKNQFQRGYFI